MRILKLLSTVIFVMSLAVPTFAQSSASGASGELEQVELEQLVQQPQRLAQQLEQQQP